VCSLIHCQVALLHSTQNTTLTSSSPCLPKASFLVLFTFSSFRPSSSLLLLSPHHPTECLLCCCKSKTRVSEVGDEHQQDRTRRQQQKQIELEVLPSRHDGEKISAQCQAIVTSRHRSSSSKEISVIQFFVKRKFVVCCCMFVKRIRRRRKKIPGHERGNFQLFHSLCSLSARRRKGCFVDAAEAALEKLCEIMNMKLNQFKLRLL
jgi:hypothetical protein